MVSKYELLQRIKTLEKEVAEIKRSLAHLLHPGIQAPYSPLDEKIDLNVSREDIKNSGVKPSE